MEKINSKSDSFGVGKCQREEINVYETRAKKERKSRKKRRFTNGKTFTTDDQKSKRNECIEAGMNKSKNKAAQALA